ncbi:MAG: group 1 truncated hemoglobin [Alphaproteobacteria bacterium]|nr:group 1 truncated hemoglobin [Alphaproteobacteria bacterium]
MSSLYEQLGGRDAVNAAVDIFYRKMLVDSRVSGFFDNTDMDRQIDKQKAFLTMAFGGPNNYSGLDMAAAHKPLVDRGLNDMHVDVVVEHLASTLRELGVGEEQIAEVARIANSVRDQVLNRAA